MALRIAETTFDMPGPPPFPGMSESTVLRISMLALCCGIFLCAWFSNVHLSTGKEGKFSASVQTCSKHVHAKSKMGELVCICDNQVKE